MVTDIHRVLGRSGIVYLFFCGQNCVSASESGSRVQELLSIIKGTMISTNIYPTQNRSGTNPILLWSQHIILNFFWGSFFLINCVLIYFFLQCLLWSDPRLTKKIQSRSEGKIRHARLTSYNLSRTRLTNQWNESPPQSLEGESAVALTWTNRRNLCLRDTYGHEV